jgi:hypothetical protein
MLLHPAILFGFDIKHVRIKQVTRWIITEGTHVKIQTHYLLNSIFMTNMQTVLLNVPLLDNKSMTFLDALASNKPFWIGQKTSFDEVRCWMDYKRGKACLTPIQHKLS